MRISLSSPSSFALLVLSFVALSLVGCGAPKASPDPATPSPDTETAAAAPTTPGGIGSDGPVAAAAAADPAADPAAVARPKLGLGPNITPDGVLFAFKPPRAFGKIYLAGNFNDWNPANNDYLMKDDNGDGVFTMLIKLGPGTYQYKYVADGQWMKDPHSPMAHPDGFGGQNGKFEVK